MKNVLFTVENTDPEVPWLTNWFEVHLHSFRLMTFTFFFYSGIAHVIVRNARGNGCRAVVKAQVNPKSYMLSCGGRRLRKAITQCGMVRKTHVSLKIK